MKTEKTIPFLRSKSRYRSKEHIVNALHYITEAGKMLPAPMDNDLKKRIYRIKVNLREISLEIATRTEN